MKNLVVAVIILSAIFTSCSKNENKNVTKPVSIENVLTDDGKADETISYNTDINGKKSIKTDYVYKATDGTLVKVVFDYNPENRTVSITNNKKTFTLEKSEAKTHETIYTKADMTATVRGDSLVIQQDKNIIELVKTKI